MIAALMFLAAIATVGLAMLAYLGAPSSWFAPVWPVFVIWLLSREGRR